MIIQLVASGLLVAVASLAVTACTTGDNGQSRGDVEAQIRKMEASVPRKVDAATTLVDVRSDGQGGIIFTETVDTSMVSFPSQDQLREMLCGVRPDSPPVTSHSPFTSVTYIYKDLQGGPLTTMHFGPGQCPGQRM